MITENHLSWSFALNRQKYDGADIYCKITSFMIRFDDKKNKKKENMIDDRKGIFHKYAADKICKITSTHFPREGSTRIGPMVNPIICRNNLNHYISTSKEKKGTVQL